MRCDSARLGQRAGKSGRCGEGRLFHIGDSAGGSKSSGGARRTMMELAQRRGEDRPPRRLRKGLYVLPSLFTTANLAAGFYAISQAALGAAHAQGYGSAAGGDGLSAAG